MYAVTGITGQVGGGVARALLDASLSVRAVVRDAAKGDAWKERGCEVALAEMNDAPALTAAFARVSGVFLLIPSNFDPMPGFPEVRAIITALTMVIEAARPPKVVCLSTIGAQATQPNLLNQLGLVEQALGILPVPVCFLRAAWFMENVAWDVAPARDLGVVPSFLQPLDKPVPMVATTDIGHLAAALLQETWMGCRVVELEGPRRITPNQIVETFAKILGRPVRMEAVPRDTWEALFASQGTKNPTPRAQMLDGFNEGWIEFANGEQGSLKGQTEMETVRGSMWRDDGAFGLLPNIYQEAVNGRFLVQLNRLKPSRERRKRGHSGRAKGRDNRRLSTPSGLSDWRRAARGPRRQAFVRSLEAAIGLAGGTRGFQVCKFPKNSLHSLRRVNRVCERKSLKLPQAATSVGDANNFNDRGRASKVRAPLLPRVVSADGNRRCMWRLRSISRPIVLALSRFAVEFLGELTGQLIFEAAFLAVSRGSQ